MWISPERLALAVSLARVVLARVVLARYLQLQHPVHHLLVGDDCPRVDVAPFQIIGGDLVAQLVEVDEVDAPSRVAGQNGAKFFSGDGAIAIQADLMQIEAGQGGALAGGPRRLGRGDRGILALFR